ncbi:MAG TPA: patatin-like phospholipase family protein [Acidimicrobiia bacterium]|nr:patatin-like phospholipase family protein [Acidimicrobiia bacterium]
MTASPSVEQSPATKADLVLEGGGVKGIGLLGAVSTLVDRGYTFPRIAGTSAGAIVGALVAAYVATGSNVDDLMPVMRALDYKDFRDETPLDHLGPPGKAAELLLGRGIYKGDFLVHWLSDQLGRVGVETFGDLRITDADDPGSSLAPDQRFRLVVMASDISKGQLVRLPWDCRDHYGIDPDRLRIVDAVRASMSIPFFFHPASLTCGDKSKVTLVDGGMLSNFPIDCFNRTDGKPARWPTFGVKLSAKPDARQVPREADNAVELAIACLETLLAEHDAYHLDDEHVTERTIFVDTLNVSATDFDIDTATQQRLFDNGQRAAKTFLDSWPPGAKASPTGPGGS